MDNKKYSEIEQLLVVMRETFGYNEELQGLIKTSITEANFMLAKKSFDLRKMFDPMAPNVMYNDENSIHSAEPINNQSGDWLNAPKNKDLNMNKTMDN